LKIVVSKIGIIILAAGSSSRMGQSKQLLHIGGKPLLLLAVEAALQTHVNEIVVVLGANEKTHRQIIEHLSVNIFFNESWEKGMGNSLKAGLAHLLTIEPTLNAVITMVSDQPLISSADLNLLIKKFQETKAKIVAVSYDGTAGVPALFDQSLFTDLLQINNELGAKKVIQQHLSDTQLINLPHAAIDLDIPEDYERFKQRGQTI
jgi:molybdenum cofactor cytidylyltransferase